MVSKMIYFALLVAGITLVLAYVSGCSGGKLLSAVSTDLGSCSKKNIIYGRENNLGLDVYYTSKSAACGDTSKARNSSDLPPTIIFVFGGSWNSGDKSQYGFVADAFTAKGYNVVIPNYRLYPQVKYPDFIHDLESLIDWLIDNVGDMHLSLNAVHLMGHSAGAYNAVMYLLDSRYQKPIKFSSFVGLAGPYDFFLPSDNPEYKPVFAEATPNYNRASELPVNQRPNDLKEVLSKAYLIHGGKDDIVSPKNIERMQAYFAGYGIKVNTKIYPDQDHVGVVSGLSRVPIVGKGIANDIVRFLEDGD